jgi:hypothetical protein
MALPGGQCSLLCHAAGLVLDRVQARGIQAGGAGGGTLAPEVTRESKRRGGGDRGDVPEGFD